MIQFRLNGSLWPQGIDDVRRMVVRLHDDLSVDSLFQQRVIEFPRTDVRQPTHLRAQFRTRHLLSSADGIAEEPPHIHLPQVVLVVADIVGIQLRIAVGLVLAATVRRYAT